MTRKLTLIILLNLLFALSAFAQTTEFTYQGSLAVSGAPATANYDFEFRLFDALSGGTQQGSAVTKLNVAVAGGIFTVPLDFGAQFPGAGRFLDISVRPAGGGAFTPLTPRQLVNSAPYSVKSLNADNAAKFTTSSNCASSASPAVCGSALAGSVAFANNATTIVVNTTAVTANSQILLQEDNTLSTRLGVSCLLSFRKFAVAGRNPGVSFTIAIENTYSATACLSYVIIN